jgi:hypothetical protein
MISIKKPQLQQCEMWAIANPDGTIMDETVVLKRKDAIYKGFIRGRCGDKRTEQDFKKEGYRVIKVDVIPKIRING